MKKKGILIGLGAVAVAAAVVVAVGCATGWGRASPQLDPLARDSAERPLTEQELRDRVQEETEKTSFRFRINTKPKAKAGGEADFCIINSGENPYHLRVSITGEDGTPLYESAVLKPGQQDMTGALQTALPAGSYPAVAVGQILDPESGEQVGTVSAELTLTVTP